MMRAVLDGAFSDPATQSDKQAARQLRDALVGTRSSYTSVLFDIMKMAGGRDETALAEIAFLIGMQAGYELGIAYPPQRNRIG